MKLETGGLKSDYRAPRVKKSEHWMDGRTTNGLRGCNNESAAAAAP